VHFRLSVADPFLLGSSYSVARMRLTLESACPAEIHSGNGTERIDRNCVATEKAGSAILADHNQVEPLPFRRQDDGSDEG
jgi:hypothetical protein